MKRPRLTEQGFGGLAWLSDADAPFGAAFAFTERAGGVSLPPYDALNLGARCGDDAACVAENRARLLAALGAQDIAERLVCPRQVHGDAFVLVDDASPDGVAAAREAAERGADGVVCTVPGVPVLMCFADCVPVLVCAPGGFALAHSGWRGALARIAGKAARSLMEATGDAPDELVAYVGPHIGAADYEVSDELAGRFAQELGASVVRAPRRLDLAECVLRALEDVGVARSRTAVCAGSTASSQDRFFSYRASGGRCGRHGALAYLKGGAA